MARTGLSTHDDLLRLEVAGGWRPESPERLLDARAGIEPFLGDLAVVSGRPATMDELALVHTCAAGEFPNKANLHQILNLSIAGSIAQTGPA
jgi:DNA-binding FadR family transcriptional regulator